MTTSRCTCGFDQFSIHKTTTQTIVTRYARTIALEARDGAGSTPMGIGIGTASGGNYGRYSVVLTTLQRVTACKSCKRARLTVDYPGVTALGAYRENDYLYVVTADASRDSSCFSLRFTGQDGSRALSPLRHYSEEAPSIYGAPETFVDEVPAGGIAANSVKRALIPVVHSSGTYGVELVDRCSGAALPLGTLELEEDDTVQVYGPSAADLGGAPEHWRHGHNSTPQLGAQLAGFVNETIPFDKCTGVVEYDARLGTDPAAQGWVFTGTGSAGDYGIVAGGALHAVTVGGQTSYWRKDLTLAVAGARAHGYICMKPAVITGVFDLFSMMASSGTTKEGVRICALPSGGFDARALDGSPTVAVATNLAPGWICAGGSRTLGSDGSAWVNALERSITSYGNLTDGSAEPLEFSGIFGKFDSADDAEVYVRNAVASTPGRFIRAGFTGHAVTTSPVLRFYMSREADASTELTARFRIKWTQSNVPYASPGGVVDVTVTLPAANQLIEMPVQLTALAASAPFRFTVERLWSHAEDLFAGIVHLHYVTVRPQ